MSLTQFDIESAGRIANVVRAVEGTPPPAKPLDYAPVLESGRRGEALRLCTFTGAWAINTAKTLTLKGQTATPNTVSATNLYLGLDPVSSCDVLIGKAGTAWYLVQPDLTKQPNYSGSGTHVLTIANGDMEWTGVESCPDQNASPASLSLFLG